MKYNIVETNNKSIVLASCNSYEFACKYLKDMLKTDRELAKYYGWSKLPQYEIIEEKECE